MRFTHDPHMKLPQRRQTSAAPMPGCRAQTGPLVGTVGAVGSGGGGVKPTGAGVPGSGGGVPGSGGGLAPGSMSTAKTARQLGHVNCPPPGTWTVFSQ
jgi:hypothetical protein